MNLNANTMATNTGTLTLLHGIDGEWMTNADLVALARQIHQRSIDNQRLEAKATYPTRHPATPGYFEYPDPPAFDESCNFEPVGIDSEGGSCD